MPSECTLYCTGLFLFFLSVILNCLKYRQNEPFTVFAFKFFSAVPNRFKCRQNAHFTVPVFKSISVIIPNCFKYRQKAPFTLNSQNSNSFQILYEYTLHLVFDLSLKFQNSISNSVRMYHFTVHGINIIRWCQPTT